jgi:hypothetical protein
LKAAARPLGSFDKLAVALIVEQHISLLVVNFGSGFLDFWIDMTIGNKYVQPAIIIVIEEASTEAKHIVCRARDSRLITDFGEKS